MHLHAAGRLWRGHSHAGDGEHRLVVQRGQEFDRGGVLDDDLGNAPTVA